MIIINIGMFQFAYKVTEKAEKLKELMEIQSACLVNLEILEKDVEFNS